MAYLNRPRRDDGTSTPSVDEDAATLIAPGPTTTLYPDCMLGGVPIFEFPSHQSLQMSLAYGLAHEILSPLISFSVRETLEGDGTYPAVKVHVGDAVPLMAFGHPVHKIKERPFR